MRILGIIPARYASTRFPAKALADIAGKSMIQRVYEQVGKANCFTKVVIATDNTAIETHAKSFGGTVCMTRDTHASGTDRCFEVLTKQAAMYDYVINIQGDEPFIQPEQIELLAKTLNGKTEIATLVKAIDQEENLFNPNVVKAVVSSGMEALYFSRSAIPYLRNISEGEWLNHHTFYKHIGMYAYRCDILEKITSLNVSALERAESLEQLRWLEHGFRIKVAETKTESIGIDTPEDLEKALHLVKMQNL